MHSFQEDIDHLLIKLLNMEPSQQDWSIQTDPQLPSSDVAPANHQYGQPQVPIILQYSVHRLATLKPNLLVDLIIEAAGEFRLDPGSFHLAIQIKQDYIKISNTLYQRIAPLSTIHVRLIFRSIPQPSLFTSTPQIEPIPNSMLCLSNADTSTQLRQTATTNTTSQQVASATSTPTTILSILQSPIPNTHVEAARPKPAPADQPVVAQSGTPSVPSSSNVNLMNNINTSTTTNNTAPPRKKFLINSLASTSLYSDSNQSDQDSNRSVYPFFSGRKHAVTKSTHQDRQQTPAPKESTSNETAAVEHESKKRQLDREDDDLSSLDESRRLAMDIIEGIPPSSLQLLREQPRQRNDQNRHSLNDLNQNVFNNLF